MFIQKVFIVLPECVFFRRVFKKLPTLVSSEVSYFSF